MGHRKYFVEKALASKFDANMEALKTEHDAARLSEHAGIQRNPRKLLNICAQSTIERAQASQLNRNQAIQPHRASRASNSTIRNVKVDAMIRGNLLPCHATTSNTSPEFRPQPKRVETAQLQQ